MRSASSVRSREESRSNSAVNDRLLVQFPVADQVRKTVDSRASQIFRVIQIIDVRNYTRAGLVRVVDDRAIELRAELLNRAVAIVHPDLDEIDFARDLLADNPPGLHFGCDTVCRWFQRRIGWAGVGRSDTAACYAEECPAVGFLLPADLKRQIARVGAERQDRAHSGVRVTTEMVGKIVVRVILRRIAEVLLITDMDVRIDERWHHGLAGKIHSRGPRRSVDGSLLPHFDDMPVLHQERGTLHWRTASIDDEALSFVKHGLRSGDAGKPAQASRGQQEPGFSLHRTRLNPWPLERSHPARIAI